MQKVDDEVFNFVDLHDAGWPSNELVKACGGVFASENQPRRVKLGRKQYEEGTLDALVDEAWKRRPKSP
jgi:hypothetical protein